MSFLQQLHLDNPVACDLLIFSVVILGGIGLGNKIRAYALQNQGADTVEANERLGFAPDLRSFAIAAAILTDLGVRSVALLTNNPDKLRELAAAGVPVDRRVPHWVEDQEHNHDYLAVKRHKLGHHG